MGMIFRDDILPQYVLLLPLSLLKSSRGHAVKPNADLALPYRYLTLL
jgi:hypothetical protein